jgi:Ca2+-binding RTX toxin-like protein
MPKKKEQKRALHCLFYCASLGIDISITLEESKRCYSISQILSAKFRGSKNPTFAPIFKDISGGSIWTLSGFVLVACADTDRSGGTTSLGGSGSGIPGGGTPGSGNSGTILPPVGETFRLESAAFTGGDSADFVIAAANANGEGGKDIIFGGTANQNINGGGGNDALFGEGGFDTLKGEDGNDLIVDGVFYTDELAAYRAAQTPFSLQIDFFSLPTITDGIASILDGGTGNDLIFAYIKVDTNNPQAINTINGDVGASGPNGGDDLIITHSRSYIIGGGGDDIFWLRPEAAGDVFTIADFGSENSGQGAVGDRFLIVSDQDFTTVDALLAEIGWVVATDRNVDTDNTNDDIRITVTATIDGVDNRQYTIDLQNYNTALTLDDFLIMTQAETEAFIAAFDDNGANIL